MSTSPARTPGPRTSRRVRARLLAVAVGAAASVLVVGLYALGGLDWLELRALDLRFRHANSLTERDDLVRVEIDDGSLQVVGHWPWPRHEQAALIDILGELGVRAVLVDVEYLEPTPVAIDLSPRDADDPLRITSEDVEVTPADAALQAAIWRAGNVYLAFHYRRDAERSARFSGPSGSLMALLAEGRDQDARRLAGSIAPDASPLPLLERASLAVALERDLDLTPQAAADLLGLPAAAVLESFEPCRQAALRRAIASARRRAAREAPGREPVPSTTFEAIAGRTWADDTSLKAAFRMAWSEVANEEATLATGFGARAALASRAQPVEAYVPVLALHAQAARRCGFVVFRADADGITRRMPLMVRRAGESEIMPQLAFGLACDLLGVSPEAIRPTPLGVRVGALEIQLDSEGRTLIPWTSPAEQRRNRLRHVPIVKLHEVYDRRRLMGQNERFIRDTIERVATADVFPRAESEAYAEQLAELKRLRRQRVREGYRSVADAIARRGASGPGGAASRPATRAEAAGAQDGRIAELEAATRAHEGDCLARLEREYADLAARPAESLDAGQRERLDGLDWVRTQLHRAQLDRYRVANVRLASEVDATMSELRRLLGGRVVLIGYTATALADMTPVPTSERAPGVLAHYYLLNGMLSGRMLTWARAWQNALLALSAGLLVSWVASRSSPFGAGAFTAALLVAISVAAVAAFYWRAYWIAITPPIAGGLAAFLAISFFQYAFVDRERRQLAAALGQYTSRAIARQMADNPELCRRAETRPVTTMFTDLRGFTAISERIGADRTQRLLNVCLGRMTDVFLRHEGMVNKFLGDGVFAFWNPVIYPQSDHAQRACAAAVDLLADLRALVEEQRRTGGDEAFQELGLRVGIATGNAVVGPCGSEQKYDYTCIGDSVNLSARLESANKFYGTSILVSAATRQAAAGFVYRPLGRVQVKGRQQATAVFELVARDGEADDRQLARIRLFSEALDSYEERRFAQGAELFRASLHVVPDDPIARFYLKLCETLHRAPPPDDWTPAIELTEK